jgi:hypothetical protein
VIEIRNSKFGTRNSKFENRKSRRISSFVFRFSVLLALTASPLRLPAATPTFKQYTYVADTGSGKLGSITSPAITLTSGDFVFVFCQTRDSATGFTVTSSPANTFNQLTSQTAASTEQASYSVNAGSGSTTFTCTPSASAAY